MEAPVVESIGAMEGWVRKVRRAEARMFLEGGGVVVSDCDCGRGRRAAMRGAWMCDGRVVMSKWEERTLLGLMSLDEVVIVVGMRITADRWISLDVVDTGRTDCLSSCRKSLHGKEVGWLGGGNGLSCIPVKVCTSP